MKMSKMAIGICLMVISAGCSNDPKKEPPPSTVTQQTTQPVAAPVTTKPSDDAPESRAEVVPETKESDVAPVTTKPVPKPKPTIKTAAPRTRVPDALVGTWDGDIEKISFSKAGDVAVISEKTGGRDSGTVVVAGSSMTLYLSGG